jgi:hypothetical protein
MGTSFTQLRFFFHKVSFLINAVFPPLRETLHAGRVERFAESSEFFTRAVFTARRLPQNGVSEFILQGAKKMEVGGC